MSGDWSDTGKRQELNTRAETTIGLIERVQRLEKQLKIAIGALEKYADIRELYFIAPDGSKITLKCNDSNCSVAKEALQQMEDLK